MATENADDLVPFRDVRVIRSTAPAPALPDRGERSVWLPRAHISGMLWCAGDRGKLFIQRRLARDSHLIDLFGKAIGSPVLSLPRPGLPVHLHLVRRDRDMQHAKLRRVRENAEPSAGGAPTPLDVVVETTRSHRRGDGARGGRRSV